MSERLLNGIIIQLQVISKHDESIAESLKEIAQSLKVIEKSKNRNTKAK